MNKKKFNSLYISKENYYLNALHEEVVEIMSYVQSEIHLR